MWCPTLEQHEQRMCEITCLVEIPVPVVSMIPPGEMIHKHVDAYEVVELGLVPSLSALLLQLPLPSLHKVHHATAVSQYHDTCACICWVHIQHTQT